MGISRERYVIQSIKIEVVRDLKTFLLFLLLKVHSVTDISLDDKDVILEPFLYPSVCVKNLRSDEVYLKFIDDQLTTSISEVS